MKNKVIIIIIAVILLVVVFALSYFFINKNNKMNVSKVFEKYIQLINDKKYEEMYEMISKESQNKISKEDFIKRNKNIYEGIDAVNIKIEIKNIKKDSNKYVINYNEDMAVSAGKINFTNVVNLIKEKDVEKIEWSSKLIFPDWDEKSKVRVSSIKSKRGDILDRNETALATMGEISIVGIVPRKIRR